MPLWAAIVLAAASGPVLDAGFPDKDIWPLAFAGIALVLVTLIGRRIGSAVLVGFIAGASFYFTHIQWATLFLGPLPMSALSRCCRSLFVALGAVAICLAYRWVPRGWPARRRAPLAAAGRRRGPLDGTRGLVGGVALRRLLVGAGGDVPGRQPARALFGWLGISGVSFVMVLPRRRGDRGDAFAAPALVPLAGRPGRGAGRARGRAARHSRRSR